MARKPNEETSLFLTIPQFERLKDIHYKIAANRYPTTKGLAKDHEVAAITISRDISLLKTKYNAPIEYDPTHNGYVYTEDYDFPLLNAMSEKDLQTLSAAKILLSHYQGTPLYRDVQKILDSMSRVSYKKNFSALKRIALPPNPQINVNQEIWDKIIKALENNKVIKFDYCGKWSPKNTSRRVRPYQILLDNGICYLWGYSEERKAERLFDVGRIKGLCITKEDFKLPKDFEFEKKCGGGRFGAYQDEKKQKYVIEFYEDARYLVHSSIWAEDQILEEDDTEDKTTITFTASQSNNIMEWILTQGCNAIPLAPEEFVKEWKAVIKRMYQVTQEKFRML